MKSIFRDDQEKNTTIKVCLHMHHQKSIIKNKCLFTRGVIQVGDTSDIIRREELIQQESIALMKFTLDTITVHKVWSRHKLTVHGFYFPYKGIPLINLHSSFVLVPKDKTYNQKKAKEILTCTGFEKNIKTRKNTKKKPNKINLI